jgi:hypothetical protein
VESRLVRKEGLRWPRLVRRGFSLGYRHISIGWRAVIEVEECTMDLADILLEVGWDCLPSLLHWCWFSWLVVRGEKPALGATFRCPVSYV